MVLVEVEAYTSGPASAFPPSAAVQGSLDFGEGENNKPQSSILIFVIPRPKDLPSLQ